MLKTRAVERFIGQVIDKPNGIFGVLLFDKDAKTGETFSSGNVYSALLSNIWEVFERQVRDELQEMLLSCENGMVIVTRVANMLIAIVSNGKVPIGLLKLKLYGLTEHLKSPLEAIM